VLVASGWQDDPEDLPLTYEFLVTPLSALEDAGTVGRGRLLPGDTLNSTSAFATARSADASTVGLPSANAIATTIMPGIRTLRGYLAVAVVLVTDRFGATVAFGRVVQLSGSLTDAQAADPTVVGPFLKQQLSRTRTQLETRSS